MTIKLGVIGCGGMESTHQRGFGRLRHRVEVTATADVLLERAKGAAAAIGARLAVTDYRELLGAVDAVLIVLPHHLHHRVGIECLRAGKHVLMEKPLAISEAECLDLIHTARACGRVLMTAYCMRFHPLIEHMKRLVDERVYGDVFQLSIWTEQHTQGAPGDWRHAAATLGGGQLFSHGCHYVDLLLWFLGRPRRGLHLGTNYGTPWMEREGTSNVTLEFQDGPLGYHFGTWGAKGTRLGYSFHAHCTAGMIEADITGGRLSVYRGRSAELLYEVDQQRDMKHTERELEHFVRCVEEGTPPLTDGPGSLQGLRVIWRLYEAERRGVVADLRGLGLDEPWDGPDLDKLPV
jgi:predicted dehydrogenase